MAIDLITIVRKVVTDVLDARNYVTREEAIELAAKEAEAVLFRGLDADFLASLTSDLTLDVAPAPQAPQAVARPAPKAAAPKATPASAKASTAAPQASPAKAAAAPTPTAKAITPRKPRQVKSDSELTPEELAKRAKNAAYQREYRAKKKAEKEALGQTGADVGRVESRPSEVAILTKDGPQPIPTATPPTPTPTPTPQPTPMPTPMPQSMTATPQPKPEPKPEPVKAPEPPKKDNGAPGITYVSEVSFDV